MNNTALRQFAVGGLACLLLIPSPRAFSAGLRDEALKYRAEGYERQQKGDREGALAAYQKAAALDPSYPTPQNDAGVLLEEMGRLDEARQSYEKALASNPNYLDAHTNLAVLYERLGENTQAVYHWLKRYQLGRPNDPWTARAQERLIALGALQDSPNLKARMYTSRRIVEQELNKQDQGAEDFRSMTEQEGRWP